MKFFKIIFILNFLVSFNVISNEHSFEIIDYENRFNAFFCNIKDSLDNSNILIEKKISNCPKKEDSFFLEEDGFFSSCNQQIDDLHRTIENLKTDNKNNSGLCSLYGPSKFKIYLESSFISKNDCLKFVSKEKKSTKYKKRYSDKEWFIGCDRKWNNVN